jgi:hypothetical protein
MYPETRHATSRWSALILPPLPLSGNDSWRVLFKTIGQSSILNLMDSIFELMDVAI